MPDAQAVAAMANYTQDLQKAGVLLGLEGLHPPSMGARLSFSGGKPKVTDGAFAEAKEVIGGYWMIQVKSKSEAIQWASRCPASDNEVIELRQVQEFADFTPDVQQAAADFPNSGPRPTKERARDNDRGVPSKSEGRVATEDLAAQRRGLIRTDLCHYSVNL